MDKLKQRILRDAKVLPGNIIKVGGFLNHMVDIGLMRDIGKEFAAIFGGQCPTKILTIEAAGIPIAAMTSLELDIPFVIAKKFDSIEYVNPSEDYSAHVTSHTKKTSHVIRVSKSFFTPDDRVLILDDFLAYGDAALALIEIVRQTQASLVGVGICVEKSFQKGAEQLESKGINLHSLVRVQSLEDGVITML
ncbi:MAG: xanthine phosphoribosyltransferase [Defluviitaleaceae bacterium]|nr:xanthine phosphoribosyltransferase [Defluviitaleaceae bacterium]